MERLSRVCVGVGAVWGFVVLAIGLAVGLDKPQAWAPFLDHVLNEQVRRTLYLLLTFVVVPVGLLTVLRDVLADPEPLWIKLALPGALVALYALFLAAALPGLGQPLLLAADPMATRIFPGVRLTRDPSDGWSWLLRFGASLVLLAGLPGAVGLLAGLLAGGSGQRSSRA
jgi:hypothetical protein